MSASVVETRVMPRSNELNFSHGYRSCNKTSSATALGILLRSSVFQELVEKNSNIPEDENEKGNTKSYEDGYVGIFYDGPVDSPFGFSFNSNVIELQGQFLLNNNYNCPGNVLATAL